MTQISRTTQRTVVTINSSGRQAASFIRVAAAVGWQVRAQMRDRIGIVATDICGLANVKVIDGELSDPKTIQELFKEPAEMAFINTTHWGDEEQIGRQIVDAAKRAGIKHLIYSSMPDHGALNKGWKGLPMWKDKRKVENYIRRSGMAATYIYCGIYHNNFTSLPYPLFRMELLDDESFTWRAPFNPNKPLPWLDAEHDVGPVVLQIFLDGPKMWSGTQLPLAFEYLTPLEVCDAFSRALGRPVRYEHGSIDIQIPIPTGYREHLQVLEETLGAKEAPYFGPVLEKQSQVAQSLWEGPRSMEEYAREVFPLEESANGLTWMTDGENEEAGDPAELDFSSLNL